MNPFYVLLLEVIYRPIFNILILFLSLFQGDLGLSIICLTLIVRLLLLKPSMAGQNVQKGMGSLQPKMTEIQEKYKDQPDKMQQEMMKLLKNEGVGPLKGCLMTFIQIPVFLGLFYVVRDFANNKIDPTMIYSFFQTFGLHYTTLEHINTWFLGMNLLKGGNIWLAAITGVLVYFQMQVTMANKNMPAMPTQPGQPKAPDMKSMMKFMNIFLIIMMGSFVYSTPTGVGLYIFTTTLFSLIQFGFQNKELLLAQRAVFQAKWRKK